MQVPDTRTNFHRPSTSRSTELTEALDHPPPLTPPKRADPVRLRQSRVYDICLFYPPSFIPISPLEAFSKTSGFPLQLRPISPDLAGLKIRTLRHKFLLNSNFIKITRSELIQKRSELRGPSKYEIFSRSDHSFVS